MKNLLIAITVLSTVNTFAKIENTGKTKNDVRVVSCKDVKTQQQILSYAVDLGQGAAEYGNYSVKVEASGTNIVAMSLVDNSSGDAVYVNRKPTSFKVTFKTDEMEQPLVEQHDSGYWGQKIVAIRADSGDMTYVESNSRKGASDMSILLKTDENSEQINIRCEVVK